MVEQHRDTAKVEFCFGALGIHLKGDEVTKVQRWSQAEMKGVRAGWKIVLVDGNEMMNTAAIRPALDRARKSGKKYPILFSKPRIPKLHMSLSVTHSEMIRWVPLINRDAQLYRSASSRRASACRSA